MLYIFIGLHNLLLLYNLYLIELYIVVNDMEVGFLICYFFFTFVSAPARVKCHSAPPVFKRGGMSLIKKINHSAIFCTWCGDRSLQYLFP